MRRETVAFKWNDSFPSSYRWKQVCWLQDSLLWLLLIPLLHASSKRNLCNRNGISSICHVKMSNSLCHSEHHFVNLIYVISLDMLHLRFELVIFFSVIFTRLIRIHSQKYRKRSTAYQNCCFDWIWNLFTPHFISSG